MRIRFSLVFFFVIVSQLEIVSQTLPTLIIPNEINGTVQLDISTIPNFNSEKSNYEYLSVFVKNKAEEYNSNPIQGLYKIENDYLIFSPYFPFERGMTYIVRTKYEYPNGSYYYKSFELEKTQSMDEAKVLSVYPTANELPENLLRFYVYFNTPMKKGQVLKHIKLVDVDGNIDNHALWNLSKNYGVLMAKG